MPSRSKAPKQMFSAITSKAPIKRGTKRTSNSPLTVPKGKAKKESASAAAAVEEVAENVRHHITIEHCKS